jgi:hypothetical protein
MQQNHLHLHHHHPLPAVVMTMSHIPWQLLWRSGCRRSCWVRQPNTAVVAAVGVGGLHPNQLLMEPAVVNK